MTRYVTKALEKRKVTVDAVAEIVLGLQSPYLPELTMEQCVQSVEAVLAKREAQHAILTGLALDELAEKGLLPEPINSIIARDEPLYGVDEILALAITNIYGSVGLTSFGYLDKMKVGVIADLDNEKGGTVNTFIDDLVGGIAAAASARLAHQFARTAEMDAPDPFEDEDVG